MGLVSRAEAAFVVSGAARGVRSDGRAPSDVRRIDVRAGVMAHAAGSARVCFGDADVIVGVQLQLESVDALDSSSGGGAPAAPPSAPSRAIAFTVECAGATSRSGAAEGADVAELMQRRLTELYSALPLCVELEQLEIVPGQTWWRINVHVLLLQAPRGSAAAFDAATLAVQTALRTSQVPRVRVLPSDGDRPAEVVLLEDYERSAQENGAFEEQYGLDDAMDAEDTVRDSSASSRSHSGLTWRVIAEDAPVTASVSVLDGGSLQLVDPDETEQACSDAIVTLAMDRHGHICGMYYETSRVAIPAAGKGGQMSSAMDTGAAPALLGSSESLARCVELALVSSRQMISAVDAEVKAALLRQSDNL
mmetsp:Transcript_11840/g.31835  ORF Transcript_11840/g.31835 Transcript_11840/m.31835 type:complete len:364 (+) Transcript_11840:202-1293(+)